MALSTDTAVRRASDRDLPAAESLLREIGLPLAGVREHWGRFLVIDDDRGIAALAGSERHGRVWLLRSVCVRPDRRGGGLGTTLVRRIVGDAHGADADGLYLLTESAANSFSEHGFIAVPRSAAPQELAASAELQGACSDSAVLMRHGRCA